MTLQPWSIHVSNINPAYMRSVHSFSHNDQRGPELTCIDWQALIILCVVVRTPILTSGLEAAQKSFEAAPKEITSE